MNKLLTLVCVSFIGVNLHAAQNLTSKQFVQKVKSIIPEGEFSGHFTPLDPEKGNNCTVTTKYMSNPELISVSIKQDGLANPVMCIFSEADLGLREVDGSEGEMETYQGPACSISIHLKGDRAIYVSNSSGMVSCN